jgi:hypothetical protein
VKVGGRENVNFVFSSMIFKAGLAKIKFQGSRIEEVGCLSPNYEARKWHTKDVHTGLNSGGRYNQSFLWSNHLHNEGEGQRVTRLL